MDILRVGVLCSHRAPGLTYLLDEDPNRGRLYDIVCCLTTEESFAEREVAADRGIPVIAHPIRRFCHARGWPLSDPVVRAAYDASTVERLAPCGLDLVVLAGYLYVLSEPMLAWFRHRIVNIHHSDLTIRNGNGSPRWPGLRAVRDALLAGAAETRATVHLVTKELDQGPPVLRSWPFRVSPLVADAVTMHAEDVFKAYVFAHQEWMIRSTWGPLAAATIELIARRRVDLCALAEASTAGFGQPWDLDEELRVRGRGPLGVAAAPVQMAWVS